MIPAQNPDDAPKGSIVATNHFIVWVDHVESRTDDSVEFVMRVYEGIVCVNSVFCYAYQQSLIKGTGDSPGGIITLADSKTSVDLVVVSLRAYNRTTDLIDAGVTGKIVLAGTGMEYVKAWCLLTNHEDLPPTYTRHLA